MTAMPQLLTDLHAATMADGDAPYGMIRDAAIAIQDGKIAWVGSQSDVPTEFDGPTIAGRACRDAGSDRLPHPYRAWRRPRGGVRDAPERGQL